MKKLVILDLDHTLVHSLTRRSDVPEAFTIHFLKGNERYYVHRRKHLGHFIAGLRKMIHSNPKRFKVAVWTAAQRNYAIKILNKIWPEWLDEVMFLRSSSHCSTLPDGHILKDMTKLPQGYDTLLVDDSPVHYNFNTANSFSVWKVSPFNYKTTLDSELLHVLQYIKSTVDAGVRFSVRPKTPSRCLPKRQHAK